jgi:hypothetical protein
MKYIWNEYKKMFWIYLLLSTALAFAPWMSGPYWADVIGTFLGAYIGLTIIVVVRTVWLTIKRRDM